MSKKNIRHIVLFFVYILCTTTVFGQKKFRCEIGPIGGVSYYIGEANSTIFQNEQTTFGGIFRYKFNPRWVIAAKAQTTALAFEHGGLAIKSSMIEGDLTAEFNFFHLEENTWNRLSKSYSPYLFMGLGVGVYENDSYKKKPLYIPVGVGFKWNFIPRLNLNIEWQHQLFLADNMEGVNKWNNANGINGGNFMNYDLLSMLTVGITVNFGAKRKVCRTCP